MQKPNRTVLIYYEIIKDIAYVIAVLPMRRDPAWIRKKVNKRS